MPPSHDLWLIIWPVSNTHNCFQQSTHSQCANSSNNQQKREHQINTRAHTFGISHLYIFMADESSNMSNYICLKRHWLNHLIVKLIFVRPRIINITFLAMCESLNISRQLYCWRHFAILPRRKLRKIQSETNKRQKLSTFCADGVLDLQQNGNWEKKWIS